MNILLFGVTGDGPRGALGVRGRARRLRRVLLLPRRLLGRHGGAGLPARDVRPHARRRADARRRESPDDVRLRLGSRHGRHRARAGVFPLLNAAFPNQMTTTERVGRAMLVVAKRGAPKPVRAREPHGELVAVPGQTWRLAVAPTAGWEIGRASCRKEWRSRWPPE